MNSTRQFNPNQNPNYTTNSKSKRVLNLDPENMNSSINVANINNTGKDFGVTSNSISNISLKVKLNDLEESIQELAKKMNQHKKELGVLKIEKDTLKELIKIKQQEVRRVIGQEINRVDEEMKRYCSHQKAENSRLNQQLETFKNDKNIFNHYLAAMFKKIRDLELQVGIENYNNYNQSNSYGK